MKPATRQGTFATLATMILSAACSLPAAAFERDGPPMAGPRPPHLASPALSEAQEDKLFAIMHAQEPQRRELERAARKAHEELRELAESGKFDEAKAAALAQAEGKAVAALSLLRARTDAQLASLLTPEQRAASGPQARPQPHPHAEARRPRF